VQSAADVAAMKASVNASQMDSDAALAGLNTSQADLKRAQADNERAKLDYDRAEGLYKQQLIAKADYDAKKAAYDSAAAGLVQAQARIAQAKAQYESSNGRISQNKAQLTRASDVLSKTTYAAPFDGTITNLPVRQGETVVVGIQNAPGSTLMTLSDLSTITAEVMVDETDIVNVKMGQDSEVSIDAIPKKTFKAKVTQIGDIAMLRSTGVATSQSTGGSQEAKDFKVVVTLTDPPPNLRPGLSCTAKITTALRPNALAVPIQALTIRSESDLEQEKDKDKKDAKVVKAAAPENAPAKKLGEELQGVFVVRNNKAEFVKVDTGIAGATDIEVTTGLKDGDEIVTGSYKILRTLKNGASVKIDNTVAKKEES
jgi:HlyD family secretion protein